MSEGIIGLTFSSSEPSISQRYGKFITQGLTPGKRTSPEVLKEVLIADLKNWIGAVENKIKTLGNALSGTQKITDPLQKESFVKSLIELGLTREQAEEWIDRGGDLATRRFASVESCRDSTVLIPYVFLTRTEYNDIKQAFSRLKKAGTRIEQAEALEEMCVKLIEPQVGSRVEVDMYKKKTLGEIWEEFFQVEFNIKSLRDTPVDGIKQLQAANPTAFNDAFNALKKASTKWSRMNIDSREWEAASQDNEKFYWIKADFFPGFRITSDLN